MKTTALAAEMRTAFAALRPSDIRELAQCGVPQILVDHFQMVGVARIRVQGELYEPDPSGALAVITPVLAQFPDTPESCRPDVYALIGNIVDLLAWDARVPQRWAFRVGAATWLGCIPPQHCDPDPVRIWRSPLNWLRAGCNGLVIVARERAEAYRLLAGCSGGIIAEDGEHAAELRQALERPWPAPRVYVGSSGVMEARRAA
jgi:hypothetical protein